MAKATKTLVSLGQLQENLEAATVEFKAAQTAFNSAAARLARAEERYNTAISSLNAGVATLKSNTKVNPNL